MTHTEDITTTTIQLNNSESLSGVSDYLEVSTDQADRVAVYIDGGSTGNVPAQYDLEHHVYKSAGVDDWFFDHNVSGETARSWSVPATGPRWRINLTNTSGGTAQYRIVVESIVED